MRRFPTHVPCDYCGQPRKFNEGCSHRRTLPLRVLRWAKYRWHRYDGPARINVVAVWWPDGRRSNAEIPCMTDSRAAEALALEMTR